MNSLLKRKSYRKFENSDKNAGVIKQLYLREIHVTILLPETYNKNIKNEH